MGKNRQPRKQTTVKGLSSLASLSMQQAATYAADGDFAAALRWLTSAANAGADTRSAEVETRYRYASVLAADGAYDDAGREVSRAISLGGAGSVPAALLHERQRLIKAHAISTRDLAILSERFGRTCPRCADGGFYTIASCTHQMAPIPVAIGLPVDQLLPPVEQIYAAGAYRSGYDPAKGDPLSVLVRREKRLIDESIVRILGAMLADFASQFTPLAFIADAVVPIPTSRSHMERRGGSIPHQLAATIRDEMCMPLFEPIVQVAEHLDHTQARGWARRQGLERAWRVEMPSALVGRSLVLVDDILTTGTTMTTAADMLLDAGAARVYGLALLHTERS